MSITSTANFTDILRGGRLLESVQVDELTRDLQHRFSEPRLLARELLQRNWLTAFQINQIFQGNAANLQLGSYVLLERLGEGGMGQVFKARNWKLGRVVALKLIHKNRLTASSAVQRFHREIRAVAQLNHPNIVRAYDADVAGDTHFFVMEYVEGTDLGKLVKQIGPLPVLQACEYTRQAALGLQHAFERGLVHRDIKPSNLLLQTNGGTGSGDTDRKSPFTTHQVKILDMGLALVEQGGAGDDGSGTLTQEGLVMGTADYMAPEQALDSHNVDIRADLYSLGCTFYFLLTGRAPFKGGSVMEKLLKHREQEAPPVPQFRADVPAPVLAILRRLMAKRSADRFQTPAELAEALGPWTHEDTRAAAATASPAGGPVPADQQDTDLAFSLVPQSGLTMRKDRSPLAILLVVALTVLLIVGGLALIALIAQARKPRPNDSPNPKRGSVAEQEPALAVAPFDTAQAGEYQKSWAKHLERRTVETNSIGMKLTLIPPGKFLMGSPEGEAGRSSGSEGLPREVEIGSPFFLGVNEVSQDEFMTVMDRKNPSAIKFFDHPVESVSWTDAVEFCRRLSERSAEKAARRYYRLPTEEEWEYAVRAGTQTAYYFGGDVRQLGEHAWFNNNSAKTHRPVGQLKPNPWGLYDVHGNVHEWCADESAKAPENRLIRGGAYGWHGRDIDCRSAARQSHPTTQPHSAVGFRVLCELLTEPPAPEDGVIRLFNGKDLAGWGYVWNPDAIAERFTVVTEDNEPALRSPGTGRMTMGTLADYQDFHLRLEFKWAGEPSPQHYATVHFFTERERGCIFQVEAGAPGGRVKAWGQRLFDEAQRNGGQVQILNRDLRELPLTRNPQKPAGEWNVLEIVCLGDLSLHALNGEVVSVAANWRDILPDGARSSIRHGRIKLGAGPGSVLFRCVQLRPIQEIPAEFR